MSPVQQKNIDTATITTRLNKDRWEVSIDGGMNWYGPYTAEQAAIHAAHALIEAEVERLIKQAFSFN